MVRFRVISDYCCGQWLDGAGHLCVYFQLQLCDWSVGAVASSWGDAAVQGLWGIRHGTTTL